MKNEINENEALSQASVSSSAKRRNEITKILYRNSTDDSECMRIRFEDIQNIIDEIIDRFGNMPKELENLIDIARIKYMAKELQIEKAKRNFCYEYDKKFFTEMTIKKLNSILLNKKIILDDMIKKIVISFEEKEEKVRKKI